MKIINKKIYICLLLIFVVSYKEILAISIDQSKAVSKQKMGSKTGIHNILEAKGYIKIVDDVDDKESVPEFRIYFNGMETFNNSDGFYSFSIEGGSLDAFSLIITKNVDCNVEKNNTLKSLIIKDSKNYRHFLFKLSGKRHGKGHDMWSWEETVHRIDNFEVPAKSILLFVNPKCLKGFESWNVVLPDKFIALPKIVLKGKYRDWMERQAKKSLLYSLDLKPFHERVREKKKVMEKGLGHVSLAR